jgi:predicted nucleic acid-binding protein
MRLLVDTGILIRALVPADRDHKVVTRCITLLREHGDELLTMPQNMAEFWNVCTRPLEARGGLGMSIEETAERLRILERIFRVTATPPAVDRTWRRLVAAYKVRGAKVHDVRLVASMIVSEIDGIVTLNEADFKRFPVTCWSPADVLNGLAFGS